MQAIDLHNALEEAGIDIVGVSIGDPDDKKTWRVDFNGTPTKAQQAAAQKVIDSLTSPAPKAKRKART